MSVTKLSNYELFHFCEQYAIILKSGIPAVEGLRIMGDDSDTQEEKDFLGGLLEKMEEAGDLSVTLEESGAFPDSMVSYVRLGETTGCLDEVMQLLADYYDQEIEISEQVRSAVTYPLLMLGMMLTVIVILLIKVLPVFSQVFRQMGLEMTGFSASMLSVGTVIQRNSAVFIALIAVVIGLILYFVLVPKGKAQMESLFMKLPHFKAIPISMDYSRLAQGISMGLRSGMRPEDSLEMASKLISVPSVKKSIALAMEKLEDGQSFTDSLLDINLFTGMEARLVTIGFQSGAGDDVMNRLSRRYAQESISRIQQAISILEPTIVIVLTVLVGLVLLSVMLPLLGILSEMMV